MSTKDGVAEGHWFPVLVHDGEDSHVAGYINISPSNDCESLQSLLSGLISAYILDIINAASPLDYEWHTIILPWTAFSLVSHNQDSIFHVFLRPRLVDEYHPVTQSKYLKNLTTAQEWETTSRKKNVREAQQQKQQQRPLRLKTSCGVFIEDCSIPLSEGVAASATVAEFHHSVHDDPIVVDGRRTNTGPIGPPPVEPEANDDSIGYYSLFDPMPITDNLISEVHKITGLRS